MEKPKKVYAVVRGRKPGIYTAWYGKGGAEEQIKGYAGARYKGFPSLSEARSWFDSPESSGIRPGKPSGATTPPAETGTLSGKTIAYTDGGCQGNPGPGGYGVILVDGAKRTEFSRGFRLTTNNRMELMACIAALEAVPPPGDVILHSDSQYVVNGMTKGWAQKWRSQNWMRTKSEPAENADLWSRMLELGRLHRVHFVWVRGHAGNPENERCDELATTAAAGDDLQEDQAYVQGRTRIPLATG